MSQKMKKQELDKKIQSRVKPMSDKSLIQRMFAAGGLNDKIIAGERGSRWSDLDRLYETMAHGLLQMMVTAKQNYDIITVAKIDVGSNFNIVMEGMFKDFDTHSKSLANIRNRHDGLKGGIKDDEFQLFMSIFDDYTTLNERFQALVAIPMLEIIDKMAKAVNAAAETEKTLKQSQQATNTTDKENV